MKAIHAVLWGSVMLLSPLYLFPSGSPQLAEYLTVILAVSLVWPGIIRVSAPHARLLRSLGIFVVYAVLVNAVWVIILGDIQMLRVPLFYAFNLILFATVLVMYRYYGDFFLRLTTILIALTAVILCFASLVTAPTGAFRQSLWFNNPNQLGYYSLLGASIFVMGAPLFKVSRLVQSVVLGCFLYLAALSLSKAAILGIGVMMILTILHRPTVLILTVILALIFTMHTEMGSRLYRNVMLRLNTVGSDADDNLAGRGYDRIWNHPEYLLAGAGEGAVHRFRTRLQGELHSTWGTLLFSYGVTGLALFLSFLRRLWRHSGRYFIYTLPAWIYGITHQGLRFTTLWVLLALVACFGNRDECAGFRAE